MNDLLREVNEGDKLSAEQWNLLRRVASHPHGFSSGIVLPDGVHSVDRAVEARKIYVRNDSGEDRDRFTILGIDNLLTAHAPGTNLDMFKAQAVFTGSTADFDLHRHKFVVLLQDIAKDTIGEALCSGEIQVPITVICADHEFADVHPDPDEEVAEESLHLATAAFGVAHIFKKGQASGGQWWASVRLGNPPIARDVYALDDCESVLPTLYVTNDLAEEWRDEKIVRVQVPGEEEPSCRTIRLPCPSEIPECPPPECVEILGTFYDCNKCAGCWLLTLCGSDPPETTLTDEDLSAYDGKVVRLKDGKCYAVSFQQDCTGATVIELDKDFADCAACGCFKLIDCAEVANPVYAREAEDEDGENVSLADFVTGGAKEGQILRLKDDGMVCRKVEEYVGEECDAVSVAIVVLEAYPECAKCTCFLLTDCDSIEPSIVTYTDLNELIGKVVRIEDICYNVVGVAESCGLTPVRVEIDSDYETCNACIVKYRLTNSCSVDCDDPDAEPMPDIVTRENMAEAVGKFVKIGGYCYSVAIATEGDVTQRELDYGEVYNTCNQCLAAGITAKKTYLTNLKIVAREGVNPPKQVAEREQQVWQDGKLLGFCKLSDIEIVIDDECPA